MTIKFANNATSTLAGAITASSTTVILQAGDGAKFPALSAGDSFMLTLVKMVSGLPVIEIVKVTARSADTCTVVRGQESTTATTFSAGDRVENRLTSGAMDDMGQKSSVNTWTAANTFNGSATFNGAVTFGSTVSGLTKSMVGLGNVDNTSDVNKPVSTAQQAALDLKLNLSGGTLTGALGLSAAAPIIQFTETDQSGAAGKFRMVFDANAGRFDKNTATAGDYSTYVTPLALNNSGGVDVTALSVSGSLLANSGLQVNSGQTFIFGGALATLANNGYMQLAGSSGLNLVFDYTKIQARNNGVATTLNLNALGGLVQAGAAFTAAGIITGSQVVSNDTAVCKGTTSWKIQLASSSGTQQGLITSDASNCFGVINSAGSLQACSLDNSGNFTAAGNITANSDERLKKNWRDMPEDFLDQLAEIVLAGVYDRIDTGETQAGMSAQAVQAICPELVYVNPETGILSLNYGGLGALTGLLLARERKQNRKEIDSMKAQLQALAAKVGA